MAFYTSSTISSELPAGFDSRLVDRFLLVLEQELSSLNLVFEPPSETIKEIHAEDVPISIFDLVPVKNISKIAIKSYRSDNEIVLAINNDYTLSKMNSFSEYYNRIRLNRVAISFGHYIEITGKFGVYIDIEADDKHSKLLKALVVDYVIKMLNYSSNDYQTVKSGGTGKSQVTFESNRNYYSSIIDDPEFQAILNYFI